MPPPTTVVSTDERSSVDAVPPPGDAPAPSDDQSASPDALKSIGKRTKMISRELGHAGDSDEERPPAKKLRLGECCATCHIHAVH